MIAITPVASALRTLDIEREGLDALRAAVDGPMRTAFAAAIEKLSAAKGRVIFTGMGKGGHVGNKLAATFASTGTPAFFVHPAEASHGDLGMITKDDAIIAISWSGETAELASIITYSRRFDVPLIALTSNADSALGKQADVVLLLPKVKEACPHGLAPTTSTTMQLALGDALAVALLEAKGFSAQDFKVFHPGGKLGASLRYVSDLMHTGDAMPLVSESAPMSEVILAISAKSLGCVGVLDGAGALAGMITDGDLRRHMRADFMQMTAGQIMTKRPNTLPPDTLASKALEQFNAKKRTQMFIVENGKPIGVLHVHDLLRAGVA